MIQGAQYPRLESVPQYVTSAAPDAMALGETCGLTLDEWQQHILTGTMGKDEEDIWSAFECCLIVSRQNGKGSILEVRELAGLFLIPSDRLAIHTAHEHKTASEHFLRVWTLIENNATLRRQVKNHSGAYGREFIQTRDRPTIIAGAGGKWVRRHEGHRLVFIARSGGSGRGFTADLLVYDEDMILDAAKVGASLPSLNARPNPQVWYAGSAGMKKSTQLALIRRRGVAAAEGHAKPEALAFYEWSIVPHDEYCPANCTVHDEPDVPLSMAKSNPGLGIRLTVDRLRKLSAGMGEEEKLREIYGVGTYPAPLDGWLVVPKKWWNATADNAETPERVQHPVFAVEISLDHSSAAIAVAGKRLDERAGVQVVEHHEGTAWIVPKVKEIHSRWPQARWVVDKRTAVGTLIADLEKAGITVATMQAQDVSDASGKLYDAFRDDQIRHHGQASLKAAMAAVDWRKLSESRAIDRIAAVDTTPLMAVTFAHWGFLRFGVEEEYDAAESVGYDLDEVIRLYNLGHYGPEDIHRLHSSGILDEKDLEALADAGIHF
jgi:hypothetical protein